MKKILLILAVFALAAPTMAAVDVNVVNNLDFTGYLNYSMTGESSRVRAWALTVTVDSGAVITAVDPCVAGENDATDKGFGIFPGTIVIAGGVITDPNTPVAPNDQPGATGTGIGTSTVILEMGSLYVDSNNPPDTGTLATITVDKNCTVTVTKELTYRGGIVRENSTQVTGPTLATNMPITGCLYEGLVFDLGTPGPDSNDLTVTALMITKWDSLDNPSCWCCEAQKEGNGVYPGNRVDVADLAALKLSWFKRDFQVGYHACSDYNLSGRVDVSDLATLKLNWFQRPGFCP